MLSENIIKKNLYSSAMEANINPDAIIEFARIFGFEIDFQRDIRKNDAYQIIYEIFQDEDGNGRFFYDPPTNYRCLSTKGLNQ